MSYRRMYERINHGLELIETKPDVRLPETVHDVSPVETEPVLRPIVRAGSTGTRGAFVVLGVFVVMAILALIVALGG